MSLEPDEVGVGGTAGLIPATPRQLMNAADLTEGDQVCQASGP